MGTGAQEIANQSLLVALSRIRRLIARGTCSSELLEDLDRQLREIREQLGLSQGGEQARGTTDDGGDTEG
ncbi:MAG: hypothetical protein Q7S89_01655 [bacterium]|nr:hypothetical protein [bacterium]